MPNLLLHFAFQTEGLGQHSVGTRVNNATAATSTNPAQSSLDGIQTQHQGHRVLRRFLKTVVLVELFGSVMEGVDEQRANPGILRYGDGAIHRVLQHGCAQFDALRSAIHSLPCSSTRI